LKQAVNILMEGAPAEVDLGEAEKALFGNLGVIAVRDLHVWTITSGVDSLTGHLVVREMKDAAARLDESQDVSWKKCS
jgi:cobalt-zinc-cadmium efflux system protein